MASDHLKESKMFTNHYSKLCNTLSDIENLLPYFVEENIIGINDVEEINATVPSTKYKKVQKLMIHISGPLKAGNTEVFYIMLKIMEERGHRATQKLAVQIRRSLSVAVNDARPDHYTHRQSSEVDTNYSNRKLYLNIAISVGLLVALLLLAIIPVMQITTSSDVVENQLSELYKEQNDLLICECLHAVCTDEKLNNNDILTIMGIVSKGILCKDILCTECHNETSVASQSISTWSQNLANLSNTQLQVTPGILKIHIVIKDSTMYMQIKPFYAFKENCLVSMRVYSNGYGNAEGTHVSVFLYLVKSPHDNKLGQACQSSKGKFKIELLNQLSDSDHYVINMTIGTKLPNEFVNGDDVADRGWGTSYFISHDSLIQSNSYNYYNNNILYFRISSYDDIDYQVLPTVIKMHDYTKKKKMKERWYSSPFFAFNGGYQMCLRVDAAGEGEGEGTHASVYLHLMKGPHDDELEQSGHWPLRGTFTIELLDQSKEIFHFHHKHKVVFDKYTSDNITNRVINGNRAAKGWGFHKFIPHDILNLLYINDSDNSAQFRISYQEQYNWDVYWKQYEQDETALVFIKSIYHFAGWLFRMISGLFFS